MGESWLRYSVEERLLKPGDLSELRTTVFARFMGENENAFAAGRPVAIFTGRAKFHLSRCDVLRFGRAKFHLSREHVCGLAGAAPSR